MKCVGRLAMVGAALFVLLTLIASPPSFAQKKKPNIVVIMTDDVGVWNISLPSRDDGRPYTQYRSNRQ
jgi:hypothetical protein